MITRLGRSAIISLISVACFSGMALAGAERALADWTSDNPVLNVQLFVGGVPTAGTEVTLDAHIRAEVTANSSFAAIDRKVDGTWRFSRLTVRAEKGLYMRGYEVIATKSLKGAKIAAGKVNVFNLNLTKAQIQRVRALQRLKGVRAVYVYADVIAPPYLGARDFLHDPAAAFSGGYFSK